MHIQSISNESATVWFSHDELSFMIAATERALGEMEPDEFDTRTGRTVGYANAVLAQIRAANEGMSRKAPHQVDGHASSNSDEAGTPRRLKVTIRIDSIEEGKARITLSDYELSFLNNVINEAIHGLRGVEEFERYSGKTSDYGRRLMRQLVAAKDRSRALE